MKRLFTLTLILAAIMLAATPSINGQKRRNRPVRPPKIKAATGPVIWQAPGAVERLDFTYGPGGRAGQPVPPFTFDDEDKDGSNPKIKVTDARGVKWSIKFGSEVNAEVFASRMAWAAGYFVEPSYFVSSGKINKVKKLDRAKKYVASDGSFADGRFELKEKDIEKRKGKKSWSWIDNPFIGTRELNGLKIIMMLTSNWDNKDVRDKSRGSNTAVFEVEMESGVQERYVIIDWGGSMGKWGNYFNREKWDCKGFASQTEDFVKGVERGEVQFGFKGQHTETFKNGIRVEDVRWLLGFLSRISDAQIQAGLRASGATSEEVTCFTASLRRRIRQLQAVAR
ncbi:MAG: hypothetical protein L0229_11700 [Blastocatellia bacterium]|nr:hypothetical protein [Blastocatellia bacterium]